MSERPPEDDEPVDLSDLEDAVRDAVEDALDEAGVLQGRTREALLSGLHEALGLLDELTAGDTGDRGGTGDTGETGQDDPGDGDRPDVTVVDGGRSRGEPRRRGPRPRLRVAGEGEGEDPAAGAGSRSGSRRVVRIAGGRRSTLGDEGTIRLDPEERQAVFRGSVPRAYRVACDRGRLAVSIDGVVVEALGPGQSVDVEGAAVVVRAADDGARGRYARL